MRTIDLPPYAPILMESTRAIGYSLEAAIADIVDNSIAARASIVHINFFPVDGEYVSILDDGVGMNAEEVTRAMQYGSKNPNDIRDKKDLGRFGLGLKTASLSQCKILTVITKQENTIECRQWDLDYIADTGRWTLKDLSEDDLRKFPHYEELLREKHGTLIIWQNLDRMKMGDIDFAKSMGRKMDVVREHLALVYHRYLSGEPGLKKLKIYLNNMEIQPDDPFLERKSTKAMADEIMRIHGNNVLVSSYILPHPSRLTAEELKQLGGKSGMTKRQGFYIYRNKRLLIWGTWFRMMRKSELSKLLRIRVDIPNSLDDLWTLDIKKSEASPPEEVKNNLVSIIDKLAEKSKRTWTYRGKIETTDQIIHPWNRLKTQNGGAVYEINREYPLIKNIIDSFPETKRPLELLFKQIEQGLPLNALYLDLTKDIKVTNDAEYEEKDVLETLKAILSNVPENNKLSMIALYETTEPFNEFVEAIDKAFREGSL